MLFRSGTQIAELVLHTGQRVNRFEDKAGFSAATSIYAMATPTMPPQGSVRKADVLDLTSKMRADGTLDWTPPAGRWVVLRFGYSLTGHQNSPASPEATGLEVDKLNKTYVKAYFDNYLGQSIGLDGGVHQSLDLVELRHVGLDRERLAAAGDQLFCQCLYPVHPTCAEHDGRAQRCKMPGGSCTEAAACARDDYYLPFNIVAHQSLLEPARYSSSVTCSIHSTNLPLSPS